MVEGTVIDTREKGMVVLIASCMKNIPPPIKLRPITKVIWLRATQAANAVSPIKVSRTVNGYYISINLCRENLIYCKKYKLYIATTV